MDPFIEEIGIKGFEKNIDEYFDVLFQMGI